MARGIIWGCVDCRTEYRTKLFTCPRCHGTNFEERTSMAKITTFGGVSDVRVSGLLPATAGDPPARVTRADGTEEELHDPDPVEDTDDTEPADADTAPETEGEKTDEDEEHEDEPVLPFDPADYTVAEVKASAGNLTTTELALVVQAEAAGKNRAGITELATD